MLDSVTLIWHISGTMKSCESGRGGNACRPFFVVICGRTGVSDTIGGNPHVALQKRATRRDSWTKAKRALFLDELEASCNVTRACRAAGVGKDAAYGLRRRDPVFADLWRRALDTGCENLRGLLVSRAIGTADAALIDANPDEADRAPPREEAMSDETRLKVLQICRAAAEGRQGRASWRRPAAIMRTADEAFAALEAKLDRVAKKWRVDGQA